MELYAALAAGLATAGLALFAGRRMLAATPTARPAPPPRAAPPPPRATPLPAAVEDAFRLGVTDRREAPRRAGNCVDILVEGGPGALPSLAWVQDRSSRGLALVLGREPGEGARLRVRPAGAADSLPWTEVCVRSCAPAGPGTWRVGCEFVRTPPWNVLMLFG
jgi:hypothetical protein